MTKSEKPPAVIKHDRISVVKAPDLIRAPISQSRTFCRIIAITRQTVGSYDSPVPPSPRTRARPYMYFLGLHALICLSPDLGGRGGLLGKSQDREAGKGVCTLRRAAHV